MLMGAAPVCWRDQPVHRVDLDGDHPLLRYAFQPGMRVEDAHVPFGLRLGYGCHVIFAHAVILDLH